MHPARRSHEEQMGMTYLIEKAMSAGGKNLTQAETFEYAQRSIERARQQESHWDATFLLEHLIKTKAEDPVRGLTADQLFELFKEFGIENSAVVMKEHERFFKALRPEQLVELTQIYVDRVPAVMESQGAVFPLSEKQRTDIFLAQAKQNGRFVIRDSRYGTKPDHVATYKEYGFQPIAIPKSSERRILGLAFASDPLLTLHIGAIRDVPAIDNTTPLETKTPGEVSIRSTVDEISRKYPELISPQEAAILWDRVKNIEVGFRLLGESAKLKERGIPTPSTSGKLLALAMGYKEADVAGGKLSDRSTHQLYELSLDLAMALDKPPFEGVPIDAEVWQGKNAKDYLDVLANLRDLSHLHGNHQAAWNKARGEAGIESGIRAADLPALKARTRQAVVEALQNVFKESKITIAREDLDALYERWGSIEPIVTLAARFQGNVRWRKEIPALAKVLKAVLGNHFEKLKYEGDPADAGDQEKAKAQLAMLTTDKARAAWRENRSRIDIFDPNTVKQETDGQRVERARSMAVTNLIPNLRQRAQGSQLTGVLREKLLAMVTGSKTPSPRELLREVNPDGGKIERTLLHALTEAEDPVAMRKMAAWLKGNAPNYLYGEETIGDLTSIVGALHPPKKEPPSVVFTTTFDNPKMLITIGDVVDTSSCQNYKTGSYVETLLGYVMDAGVKGVASYAIRANHFAVAKDYQTLTAALEAQKRGDGTKVKSDLDGDRGTARITISRAGQADVVLETQVLGKAQVRVVAKLGKTDGGRPGLFLERPYEQSHQARSMMVGQINELEAEMAGAIGGVTNQEITIPASRNDGGVYSDASGGARTDEYKVGGRR